MAGELIGTGRDCDVFEAGPGRVLRRNRAGESTEGEASLMHHLAEHGYPVPTVFEADGPDIVMERLDGPTMLHHLAVRPWSMAQHANVLADLVRRLGDVPVPDGLRAIDGTRDAVVHLDLHPDNVVLSDRGPIVIDWSNAAAGPRGLEAANTWLTLAAGTPPGSFLRRWLAAALRRFFIDRFIRGIDRPLAVEQLRTALALRELDPNLTEDEVATMRAVVDDVS